jgi:membrane protein implicated in regulation of membrane protease activity
MPFGLIALIASIAFTGVYVFVTEASYWWKGLVVGQVLLVSLLWRYGMFLQVAISIGLSLYFTYLKARCATKSRHCTPARQPQASIITGVGEADVFHHAADVGF